MAMEKFRCPKIFLVGKVLSRKAIRANLVMAVFKDLWSSKADVEAMVIRDNRILLCFNLEAEVQCVLQGSPWYFGKTLLVLAEVKGFDVHVEVPLREQEFWV
ncbi:hypothetical protein TB1_031149 [Malus domestica]